MSIEKQLHERSTSTCELCTSTENLTVYTLPNSPDQSADTAILICKTCNTQIENHEDVDTNHWRCLNDSMWSTVPAVQVMAWRMLNRLKNEGWPQDLLDMMYLDDETLTWAKLDSSAGESNSEIIHKDVNGVILQTGDSVVLIKDLKVKGSSMVAKQGTAVRNIRLDHENPEYIEGNVAGQQILIITKYVKKT